LEGGPGNQGGKTLSSAMFYSSCFATNEEVQDEGGEAIGGGNESKKRDRSRSPATEFYSRGEERRKKGGRVTSVDHRRGNRAEKQEELSLPVGTCNPLCQVLKKTRPSKDGPVLYTTTH